jgi:flagellar biosynthesis protein FlhG
MEKISRAFSLFEHEYDTIIVDTGAGVSNNVLSFVLGADTVLLVVTPDPASIADAYGMIKVIRHTNKTLKIVMIANMVDNMESGENLYKKMKLMVNRFLNSEIIYGGAIPRDTLIARSVKRQRPLAIEHPSSIPMNAIKMVTRRLLRIPKSDGKDRLSFFDRFINNKHMEVEG